MKMNLIPFNLYTLSRTSHSHFAFMAANLIRFKCLSEHTPSAVNICTYTMAAENEPGCVTTGYNAGQAGSG